MSEAKQQDTVKVHYTGRLEDGTVFDSSDGRDPIEFKIGEHAVIPGFEEAVVGMNPGEKKTETVPPDKAYGPFQDELIQQVDRNQFPDSENVEIGQRFTATLPDQQQIMLTVVESDEQTVTVDANHPLAGKNLIFDLELVDIV